MTELITPEALSALLQVIMIDLVLAGDNAIVIGLAAAGLPKDQRAKAILIGIIAATVLRIGFAAATTQLLQIVGLLFAGGVLLLWVCWKMWRELQHNHAEETQALTGMMLGGVTVLALPPELPVYVDDKLTALEWVILGGGSRSWKVKTSPEIFRRLPGATIVSDLGVDA